MLDILLRPDDCRSFSFAPTLRQCHSSGPSYRGLRRPLPSRARTYPRPGSSTPAFPPPAARLLVRRAAGGGRPSPPDRGVADPAASNRIAGKANTGRSHPGKGALRGSTRRRDGFVRVVRTGPPVGTRPGARGTSFRLHMTHGRPPRTKTRARGPRTPGRRRLLLLREGACLLAKGTECPARAPAGGDADLPGSADRAVVDVHRLADPSPRTTLDGGRVSPRGPLAFRHGVARSPIRARRRCPAPPTRPSPSHASVADASPLRRWP